MRKLNARLFSAIRSHHKLTFQFGELMVHAAEHGLG
jgi:hypothetical protein